MRGRAESSDINFGCVQKSYRSQKLWHISIGYNEGNRRDEHEIEGSSTITLRDAGKITFSIKSYDYGRCRLSVAAGVQ